MPLYTNIGGTRKELTSIYPNVGGARKSMAAMYANIDGAQKQIFTNQKTVQLSTLSVGDSFYLTDSEGFSEYTLLKKVTDYESASPVDAIMVRRVNALNVNIVSAVKEITVRNSGDPYITNAVNSLSAVKTYKDSLSSYFMYNMYIPTTDPATWYIPDSSTYNAVAVFLGLERLANFNIYDSDANHRDLYFYGSLFNGTPRGEPTDVVNTNKTSDVYCCYNNNSYTDNSGSSYLEYYYYQYYIHSGTTVWARAEHYSESVSSPSYTITYTRFPSALYFRPHVVFAANKEVTILIP